MILYRKIIHPYRLIDGVRHSIEGYKGKWFSEESEKQVRKDIYNNNAEENETLVSFCRRFELRWEYRYVKVDFTTSMDAKIEDLN